MQGYMRELLVFFLAHKGRVLGAIFGLIAGILLLKYGFWKTLLVLICTVFGYFIGRRLDAGQELGDFLQRLLQRRDGSN